MEVSASFWKGKKVFLTGHTGFKGSWLSLWLQDLGAEVTGYSLPALTEPSLFALAKVDQEMTSIFGDIRDLPTMKKALIDSKAEIVIHMAAQALVIPSYENPVDTYMTNVIGTVNLLESVRHAPSVKSVVIVTSDKCYENKEWVWPYRENEPMGGYDPYSNSKGCAELVTSAYRSSFFSKKSSPAGVAVASVRAGNVIGGGDWAAYRLIPDILKSFSEGNKVQIRNPHAIRPWQHVLEPLSGYLMLAEKLYVEGAPYAEAWNFGPASESQKPVSWLVEKMKGLWGEKADFIVETQSHSAPHEAHNLMLDSSKAHKLLGWRPRWSLLESLNAIIVWHKAYLEKGDLRELSIRQVRQFMKEEA